MAKTYQLESDPNRLWFTNYDRMDETIIFSRVLESLGDNPDIIIGEKKTGPYMDQYECLLSDNPFLLFYDLDYGPGIYAESQELISVLKEYLEQCQ